MVSPRQSLVLASGNPGKLTEFSALLAPQSLIIQAQSALNVPSIDETGLSFVENAILKARNAAKHTGLAALADDSGLVVPALNGAPGIFSARYAGADASDRQNYAKLLAALGQLTQQHTTARDDARMSGLRAAYYVCILVVVVDAKDPCPLICEGRWSGEIAEQAVGDGGFGYDPVFWLPEHDCSAAQLSPAEKNQISHRGQAMKKLVALLDEKLGEARLTSN